MSVDKKLSTSQVRSPMILLQLAVYDEYNAGAHLVNTILSQVKVGIECIQVQWMYCFPALELESKDTKELEECTMISKVSTTPCGQP